MPVKPTEKEDEYIMRIEKELKKKIAEGAKQQASKEEMGKLKALHYMKCPKCGLNLIEIEFKGVKIDECSSCKGIWLDAGEYDSLVKIEKPVLERLFNVFKK